MPRGLIQDHISERFTTSMDDQEHIDDDEEAEEIDDEVEDSDIEDEDEEGGELGSFPLELVPWNTQMKKNPRSIVLRGTSYNILPFNEQQERRSKSFIFDIGTEYRDQMHGRRFWKCSLCRDLKLISIEISIAPAAMHLAKEHQINPNGQMSISNHSNQASQFNINHTVGLLMNCVIYTRMTISSIENPRFRDLMYHLNPNTVQMDNIGQTLRHRISKEFASQKKAVQRELVKAISKIHISFDIWKTSNILDTVAVSGHFIDESYKNRSILLGIKRLIGYRNGPNLAHLVLEIIKSYGIANKVGHIMAKNLSVYDDAIKKVIESLQPNPSKPERHRLPCLGHTINQVIRLIIFGNSSTYSRQINGSDSDDENEEDREFQFWRKLGPVGKLHNICTYGKYSHRVTNEYEWMVKNGDPKMMDLDNENWHVLYQSLDAAKNHSLKVRIRFFCEQFELKDDTLTESDWEQVEALTDVLECYSHVSKRISHFSNLGAYGVSWEAIPLQEYLTIETNEAMAKQDPELPLSTYLKHGLNRMEKHSSVVYELGVYDAATLLNPAIKSTYFEEEHGRKKDVQQIVEECKQHWVTFYKPLAASFPPPPPMDIFHRRLYRLKEDTRDEFDRYMSYGPCSTVSLRDFDPINWWREYQRSYPTLALYAFDVLSVPAMSFKSDRLLDSNQQMQSSWDEGEDLVEARECMRNWAELGIISKGESGTGMLA